MSLPRIRFTWQTAAVLIFFAVIASLSVIPLNDFDIWFHIKSGEVILQKGIIHYDVFSYNTAGREWYPYEWLFQVGVYLIQKIFGFQAIKYVIAGTITVMTGIVYVLAKKIFSLPWWAAMAVTFFYYVSIYEFFSARPHIIAYTCLLAILAIIFLYIFKKKNYLLLTIPIMFVWTNLHGSVFLGVYLAGAYGAISYFFYLREREHVYLSQAKTLGIYTLLLGAITIAPPLYFTQYRLLWLFFVNRSFISSFIDEWTPLASNSDGFLFFSGSVAVVLVITIVAAFVKKRWAELIWIAPLLAFLPMTYMASRNVVLGYITLSIFLAWAAKSVGYAHLKHVGKIIAYIAAAALVGFELWVLTQKQIQQQFYYPVDGVKFLLAHHINGHMFNEYGYGGYLLYHLYPQYQVFFDGRTDLYLTQEMPDTTELSTHKNEPDTQYKKTLDWLWNKYDISFVVMRTQKHSVLRKIGEVLTDDPTWSLVYWDDDVEIFVRHDGKNDSLIEKYANIAATPFSRDIYRPTMQKEALSEYQSMNAITPSARNENAIGYFLLEKRDLTGALPHFEKALALDPTFESPYMNIAEIDAANNDYGTAVELYQKAMNLAPDRGMIYIRLGQLYLVANRDMATARKVWELGLTRTSDADAKNQLKRLLTTQP